MSRRLLTTRIATISRPIGTDDGERQPGQRAGLHERRPDDGDQAEEDEDEHLAQRPVAVGERTAGVGPGGGDADRARRRPATSSTGRPAPRPATAATAKARHRGDQHLPRRCGPGADEPHRADPVGVGAAPAVGVVVGVVDRDLQGERDDQGEERGQRPEAAERGGGAGADEHRGERGRQGARPGAGDPLRGGGHQPSTAPGDGPPVGLAGVQQRDGGDDVQLPRRRRGAQPLGHPRAQRGQGRAAPGRRDDGRHHPLAPLVVGPAEHHRVGDVGVLAQHRLDRLRRDVHAAADHHVVQPAVHGQPAVGVQGSGVAGARTSRRRTRPRSPPGRSR